MSTQSATKDGVVERDRILGIEKETENENISLGGL